MKNDAPRSKSPLPDSEITKGLSNKTLTQISTENITDGLCNSNTPSESVEIKLDPLEVSRYPIKNCKDITVSKIQEIRLQQKIIKEIKFVQSLSNEVLHNQELYWLFTNNITDEDVKSRIKSAIETYCMLNVRWISGREIEINIDPECRIEKVPSYKKKL